MSLADKLKQSGLIVKPQAWKLRPEVLLCDNIPKPLYGVNPRSILGSKWWDETRQAAYRSTEFHCIACGTPKHLTARGWLEGHEIYEVSYDKGRAKYLET